MSLSITSCTPYLSILEDWHFCQRPQGSLAQVRVGAYDAALAAYSRAADLAPGIAGYRLRQAELLFQNARAGDADTMMRGVVRKNPNFAGGPNGNRL